MGAMFVVNPDPERGQLSSLQTALAAVPGERKDSCSFRWIARRFEKQTVAMLVDAFHREPATLLVIPRYRGKRGHPVCARRA